MENHDIIFHHKHFIKLSHPPHDCGLSRHFQEICIICEKYLLFESIHFHCSVCDFRLHRECYNILCAWNQTINRPETHSHTLTFIRKMNTFNCVACGNVHKYNMNMYGCLPCSFFVHRRCIYLPKVIKLTSHSHLLLHTFQVLDDAKYCRICDESLDYEYGGYICTQKSCAYSLHSYCATRKEIWDGKDVEREPEEVSNSEDVVSSSLVELDSKTSRHFSHHHDLMKLCVNDEMEDKGVCHACVLPIDFGSFLGCKECDFALHDTCASLPRKLEHTFHLHSLTLEVNIKEGFFSCSKCERESCGFMYQCYQKDCEFKMDAWCAFLSDPLYNRQADVHPFLLSDQGARCNQCRVFLTPKRATLPTLVKYKYDIHPLDLFLDDATSSKLYCEICEVKIKHDYEDLYECTECGTILCVVCAIGKYLYLKPGITIKSKGFEIDIASKCSFSRPICHTCQNICQDKLVFKNKRDDAFFLCSINCIISS